MKRVKVKRVDLKELYKRFFKKLDVVYEKIKNFFEDRKYTKSYNLSKKFKNFYYLTSLLF